MLSFFVIIITKVGTTFRQCDQLVLCKQNITKALHQHRDSQIQKVTLWPHPKCY